MNPYSPNTLYKKGSIVSHEGDSWEALQPSMGVPPSPSKYWTLYIEFTPVKEKALVKENEELKEKIITVEKRVEVEVEKIIEKLVRPSLDTYWIS